MGTMGDDLIGMAECPAVDAVVGGIETALREPSDVAMLETA
jgi:hypothetical protein